MLREPAFTDFNPQTLAVKLIPADTPLLSGFDVAGGRLRVATVTGEAYDFPWMATGTEYPISSSTSTGPFASFTGSMFAATDGSFWRAAGASPQLPGDVDDRRFIVFGGQPTTLAQIPTAGTAALGTRGLVEPLPFLGGEGPAAALQAVPGGSPLYLRYGPGLGFASRQAGQAPPVGYQTSLVVLGQGVEQRSSLTGAVVTLLEDAPGSGRPALSGRVRGSYLPAAGQAPLTLRSSVASIATGQGSAIYGGSGEYMMLNPSSLTVNPQTGAIARQAAGLLVQGADGSSAGGEYFVLATQPAAAGSTPPDFLQSRQGRTMRGFTGGVGARGQGGDGAAPFVFIDASGTDQPGGVSISTNPEANSVTASMLLVNLTHQAGRILFFGGEGGNAARPASAFIDDSRYIALESPVQSAYSGSGQEGQEGQEVASQGLVMVTATSVDPSQIGLGKACRCDYLDWGFWSGDLEQSDGTRERYHMASWVAGELPELAEIPTAGTATYGGQMLGSVVNEGAAYIAGGNMGVSWDFAERAGQFQVDGFDAADYAGQMVSLDGRQVFGVAEAEIQGRLMSVTGSFFAGGGDPVAAMGGNFLVQNETQSYTGAGTWALDRQP